MNLNSQYIFEKQELKLLNYLHFFFLLGIKKLNAPFYSLQDK